jgi:hypothetical protein
MIKTRLLGIIVLFCTAPAMGSAPLPFAPHFSAEYSLHALGLLIGKAHISLSLLGKERYLTETSGATAGVLAAIRKDKILLRSEWLYQDGGVRPLTYRHQRTRGKSAQEVEITFDWQNRVVHNGKQGKEWRIPLPQGALDGHIFPLALMQDLSQGKRVFEYTTVADEGKLRTYRGEVVKKEPLDTALGSLQTLQIRRLEDSKRQTRIWCAPLLSYLPVRIEHQEKDGIVISVLIESVAGLGLPGPASAPP